MAIEMGEKWWIGSEPADLVEYLDEYSSDGYIATEFRSAVCECGSEVFLVETDDQEGAAERVCNACGREHYIGDSGTYWGSTRPKEYSCPNCKAKEVNVCIGFALDGDRTCIEWLYLGVRCVACGVMECAEDWHIEPDVPLNLIDSA